MFCLKFLTKNNDERKTKNKIISEEKATSVAVKLVGTKIEIIQSNSIKFASNDGLGTIKMFTASTCLKLKFFIPFQNIFGTNFIANGNLPLDHLCR